MQDKVYVLFAGCNGSGKSTIYNLFKKSGSPIPFCDSTLLDSLPLANSDRIANELGDWRDDKIQSKAGFMTVRMIRNCLKNEMSFCQETTLTGIFVLDHIKEAKAKGYKVAIVYVGLESVEIAKQRVQFRVSRNGHDVPVKDIIRRYDNSFENLNKIMEKCDCVLLYDNSSQNGFIPVAEYDGKSLKLRCDQKSIPEWVEKRINIPIDYSVQKKLDQGYPGPGNM